MDQAFNILIWICNLTLLLLLLKLSCMNIVGNIRLFWAPVAKRFNRKSMFGFTKKATQTFFSSFLFIIKFFYYVMAKPEKITVQMSKTAEKVSEVRIPKFLRKKFFTLYSKKYHVKLDQIVEPLDSFESFSAFFTRKVKPREIDSDPSSIICPADSKVLKISEITEDKCSIIKGASYSLGQLIEGQKITYTKQQVQNLKKKSQNKLYQVIFYLAPGDYHRFHTPTQFAVEQTKAIDGALYSVSEKTLIKRKKVYEKNARLCVQGTWKEGYLNMIMVGALNVGRIIVRPGKSFEKGDELGYFNLGSTIVMLIEGKNLEWHIKEGQKVRFSDIICHQRL